MNAKFNPKDILHVGDVFKATCRVHGKQTEHLYTGHSIVCLVCHPEQRPREEAQDAAPTQPT